MSKKGKKGDKASGAPGDGTRIPTVLDVDVLEYIPKSRTEMRRQRITGVLDELFRIFEQDGGAYVDVRDVGVIVRGAGLNPSEATLLDIIEAVEGEASTGRVSIPKLKEVLIEILLTYEFKGKMMARDGEERILQAFRTLDVSNKGYLETDFLKEVMTTMGERFNIDEVVEMLSAAADPETGYIYYEDFAAVLATE